MAHRPNGICANFFEKYIDECLCVEYNISDRRVSIQRGDRMTREEVANICKAMSDSNRLRIIEMLTQGEKCGCNLLEELQVTQPTLSHHMKVLGDCGLVSSYKDGKWQHYSINCEKFKEYKDYIAAITCCGNTTEDILEGCCETNCCSNNK